MIEDNISSEPQETDLGAALKSLREAKGFSLDDIYRATMIPVSKIELLEKNDYSFLDAPVFVNGYIRSYAKKLGADADAMVALYQKGLALNTPVNPIVDGAQAGDINSEGLGQLVSIWDRYKGLIVVIAAVVVFVCVWLAIGREPEAVEGQQDVTLASSDARASNADTDLPRGIDVEQLEIDKNKGAELINVSSVAIENRKTKVQVEIPATQGADLGTSSSNLGKLTAGQTETASPPMSAADQSTDADEMKELSIASTDQLAGSSQLDFSFTDDCWLEVKDSDDEVLIAKLMYKGDNLRLFGQAPFRIMFGNAQAVELKLDSKPVTLRTNGSAKTLRITLPAW